MKKKIIVIVGSLGLFASVALASDSLAEGMDMNRADGPGNVIRVESAHSEINAQKGLKPDMRSRPPELDKDDKPPKPEKLKPSKLDEHDKPSKLEKSPKPDKLPKPPKP